MTLGIIFFILNDKDKTHKSIPVLHAREFNSTVGDFSLTVVTLPVPLKFYERNSLTYVL